MDDLTPSEAAILEAALEYFDRYDRGLVGEPIVGVLNNPFLKPRPAAMPSAERPPVKAAPPRKKDKRSARHTKRRR